MGVEEIGTKRYIFPEEKAQETELFFEALNDIDARIKALIAKVSTPLAKVAQHSVAEVADTDILASDLTPTITPCLFRIMVMLETSGIFSAILKSGGTSKTLKLNAGNSLLADCAYEFDILVHSGDTVNFQTSVSGDVSLRVQEVVGASQ